MAAAFILLLALLAVTQAEEVTDPCQGGPASWCRDVATAVRCQKEQQCRQLWDSLGTWDEDEGDAAAPGKGKKCSICTKVLQQLKKMVGDDPDEETVKAALRKVCGAMKGLGRVCKAMVKKFGSQIAEALQNDWRPHHPPPHQHKAHPPEPAYRRKPNPVRRFDGDVLSPSYIQSFRERQTGPSLTSLMASSHAVVDLDYDCSSTVPLTTGSGPAVRV